MDNKTDIENIGNINYTDWSHSLIGFSNTSTIDIIDKSGNVTQKLELNKDIFNCEYNRDAPIHALKHLQQIIRWHRNKKRGPTQYVRNRSEVSGAHRKIWSQKESGRARQGDGKACHFRGGGAAFAIHGRDYSFKLNKKYKQLCMKIALTHKLAGNGILVVDSFANYDLSKTKSAKAFIEQYVKDSRVLFVTNKDLYRSPDLVGINNLPYVNRIPASGLNVLSLCDSKLVFDLESINEVQSRFAR